jgi:16S rRNA (adenine1518-N6/adenine1519-N6)-dimethyltransferase
MATAARGHHSPWSCRPPFARTALPPHERQPDPVAFARMEALTGAAFGQRRKMLRGSLRGLGGEALLARAEIAPERRAETLSVAEFDRLVGLIGGPNG